MPLRAVSKVLRVHRHRFLEVQKIDDVTGIFSVHSGLDRADVFPHHFEHLQRAGVTVPFHRYSCIVSVVTDKDKI
jgi:hypothetical protein